MTGLFDDGKFFKKNCNRLIFFLKRLERIFIKEGLSLNYFLKKGIRLNSLKTMNLQLIISELTILCSNNLSFNRTVIEENWSNEQFWIGIHLFLSLNKIFF